jgi:hypothetical protein
VCTADGAGSFQCRLTMTPNPSTRLVTLPEVVTGKLARKFEKFRSTTNTPTSSLDPTPTRTRRSRGPSHASRQLSHRVRISHSMSTSHTASATLARPMRKLSLRAGLATRSSPTTPRTPTPSLDTTRTPPTSSTSDRTPTSPSPRSPRPSNRCQG